MQVLDRRKHKLHKAGKVRTPAANHEARMVATGSLPAAHSDVSGGSLPGSCRALKLHASFCPVSSWEDRDPIALRI